MRTNRNTHFGFLLIIVLLFPVIMMGVKLKSSTGYSAIYYWKPKDVLRTTSTFPIYLGWWFSSFFQRKSEQDYSENYDFTENDRSSKGGLKIITTFGIKHWRCYPNDKVHKTIKRWHKYMKEGMYSEAITEMTTTVDGASFYPFVWGSAYTYERWGKLEEADLCWRWCLDYIKNQDNETKYLFINHIQFLENHTEYLTFKLTEPRPATPVVITQHIDTTLFNSLQRWAVVIGVSDYKCPYVSDLDYADDDAISFFDFLLSPQSGLIPHDNILLLTNQDATRDSIYFALNTFLANAGKNDPVYFFFAGHGTSSAINPTEYYLIPYDFDVTDFEGTAVPVRWLKDALDDSIGTIKSNKVTIVVDACHSGGITDLYVKRQPQIPSTPNLINQYILKLSNVREYLAVLTACDRNEGSYESNTWGGGHGVFTFYLTDGLTQNADLDGDSFVSLAEIIDYTTKKVKIDTHEDQCPITAGQFDASLPISIIPQQPSSTN